MDEIDYFPKRDKFKVQKDVGSDWNKLKKQKINQPGKAQTFQNPRLREKSKKIASTQHISLNFLFPACYVFLFNADI